MKWFGRMLIMGALGLLSIGAAPLPQGSAPYGPPRALPMDYVDPSNGFSLGVPGFAGRNSERSIAVWFQAPPENGFSSNINVLVDPVKTTRADYLDASLAAMKKSNPMARYHSLTQVEVSGHEAEILDYDISVGGRRLRFLQLLVVDEDAAYVVTCTAPTDRFSVYEPEFRRCIESFRLLHNVSE